MLDDMARNAAQALVVLLEDLSDIETKLRTVVRTYLGTPILINGSFVPIDEDQWEIGQRHKIATPMEMLDEIAIKLKTLETANAYLRGKLNASKVST